jgi:hypothetical protein
MNDGTPLHIVYCESRMLLTKRHYDDWRQIQSAFPDYKTSLGPWPAVQVMDFFRHDWGEDGTRWPFTREQIAAFLESDHETITRNVA